MIDHSHLAIFSSYSDFVILSYQKVLPVGVCSRLRGEPLFKHISTHTLKNKSINNSSKYRLKWFLEKSVEVVVVECTMREHVSLRL